MTFTPIPNGVRIVHLGQVGNIDIVNTVGAINGGTGVVGSSLSSIAKSHGDAWRKWFVAGMWNNYVHYATLAYSLEDQSAAAGDAGYTNRVAGGSAAGPAPLSASVVISLRTAKRGRTYQGRMFLGCQAATNVGGDGHSWATALVNQLQSAINGYKADTDPNLGGNGRMAVCSKGSLLHNVPAHAEPVTQCLVRAQMGTQRRRLS